MAKMKLKVAKVRNLHPGSKKVGYYARIITRGTAGYDRLVETVCRNTSIHRSEAKVALDLCMEGVAELLAEGYIVDLGPVGRLYPSCSSGWKASAAELKLADVKPLLSPRPRTGYRHRGSLPAMGEGRHCNGDHIERLCNVQKRHRRVAERLPRTLFRLFAQKKRGNTRL